MKFHQIFKYHWFIVFHTCVINTTKLLNAAIRRENVEIVKLLLNNEKIDYNDEIYILIFVFFFMKFWHMAFFLMF